MPPEFGDTRLPLGLVILVVLVTLCPGVLVGPNTSHIPSHVRDRRGRDDPTGLLILQYGG